MEVLRPTPPPPTGSRTYRVLYLDAGSSRQLYLDIRGTTLAYKFTDNASADCPGLLQIRNSRGHIVFTMPLQYVLLAYDIASIPQSELKLVIDK